MTDQLSLRPGDRERIEALLRHHLPNIEVWAYGSRVNGRSHDASDLDLVLRGDELEPIAESLFTDLVDAFEESDIPILIDVHDWARLPESFHQDIEHNYVVLQEGATYGGWRKTTFGEVVEINPKRSLKRGRKAPFVAMADVLEHQRQLPGLGTREFKGSGSRFCNGDTLLARITPCLENGKTAWVSGLAEDEIGHGSTEFIVLSAKDGITDPRFVYYLARNPHFRSYAIGQMTGTSGRQRVPVAAVESYELSLPPLDEQRRIAHILGTLDDKIELNRRMSQTLEAMAQTLFKSWFVDFDPVQAKAEGRPTGLPPDLDALFPDKFQGSELGEIPSGWEVETLGDVIELAYGKALRAKDRKQGSVPVYGSNGQIGWHDQKLVTGPGIVVGRKGNPGVVKWSTADFFPIDTTFYVVTRRSASSLHFLFFALEQQSLPSVAADSAVPGLNRNLAYMDRVTTPPIQLVELFESHIGALFARSHSLDAESAQLVSLRDALLSELLSDKVSVAPANASPKPDSASAP